MVVLKGKNLGDRQRELNQKVIDAVASNVDFHQVKDATEQSDIDKLFKIDVASKYKNVDYIIDVLKAGDTLHISRALKSEWLFGDEFSNVINVDYLHQNVFPLMSIKMKKKLLTTISIHLKNEDRAASFYTYCKDAKLNNIAYKFLLYTSESFKLELSKTSLNYRDLIVDGLSDSYLKHFIKNSFVLAESFVAEFKGETDRILHELGYLYSVSSTQYLNLLEKYYKANEFYNKRFGLRLSKDIITKHKERVLKDPCLYTKILNKNTLVKHSNVDNAKTYLTALLPKKDNIFWGNNFYNTYKYIIDIIPFEERFDFLKKIFTDKYPKKPFETTFQFYNYHYYSQMTPEVREAWALRQVESQSELLGVGNDYIWYKFVNFDKAFAEIKKFIMITPDKEKRLHILNVLVESAKNQRDLEKLFCYFYERHVNEVRYAKENFLDEIIHKHNVFEFDEDCWTALNKIFYSLEVYSVTGYHNSKVDYRLISIIYHVIKKKDLPEALLQYMDTNLYFYTLKCYTDKLNKEEEEMVYQYLFDFYINKLKGIYDGKNYSDEVKLPSRKYIYFILDLLNQYKRSKEDCPEIVMKLIKLDWDEFKFHALLRSNQPTERITQHTFIRYLKKDATLVVDKLPVVKDNIENSHYFKLNTFLQKLRVYYPNDISKKYMEFFNELLSGNKIYHKVALAAVYGIFQLADDRFKVEFMEKHAPLQPKIDHSKINEKLLYIQQAICAGIIVSRPPVPLKNVMMYIKGDYVHHCLPLFNSYLVNLPGPLCIAFIESILNAPLSIQKHGLRLAFVCFNTNDLVRLVKGVWKKTKNVSLRMIIYKALFDKILDEERQNKIKLYEALKSFTLDLHEDDDNEIYSLVMSNRLPAEFLGDNLETAWTAIIKLPPKINNLKRVERILMCMERNIDLMRKETLVTIINEHINSAFKQIHRIDKEAGDQINKDKLDEIKSIATAKWKLTAKYITLIRSNEDLDSRLEMTKIIMNKFIEKWDEHDDYYTVRKLCSNFIGDVDNKGYENNKEYFPYVNVLLENILEMLRNSFSVEQIYTLIWGLRLRIIARKIIIDGKTRISNKTVEEDINSLNKEIGINLGKEVGLLLQEFISKEMFFTSFFQEIKDLINMRVECVVSSFFTYETKHMYNIDDFWVNVVSGLTQIQTRVTNMMALKLVPLQYNGHYLDDYKRVLNNFKEIDDKELRCYMYHKFVNSDLKFREGFTQF